MNIIDKKLVIIGSNEYSETTEGCFFRSGLESQMEDLARHFKFCVHYSPKSKHTFDGYRFSEHVQVMPFSVGHHESHMELWRRRKEYWSSIKRIYGENQEAIFMVFFPDSYIGIISALYLKLKKAKFFIRITSNQLEEMKVRGNKFYRKLLYYIALAPYWIFMKWLLAGVPQVYTGKKIFYNNRLSFSVNSSNLYEEDVVEKTIAKKEKLNLLYVGRFDYYKGLFFLIDLLPKLSINFNFKIVGFGNSEETDKLKDAIKMSSVGDRIVFAGHVEYGEKLFKVYDEADVLLVPAFYETQGKTYLEAMARGVIVIASNVGGIPNIIKDGVNGILLKAGNKKQWIERINSLVVDFEQQERLIKNGYITARKNTIESITDTTLRAISENLLN